MDSNELEVLNSIARELFQQGKPNAADVLINLINQHRNLQAVAKAAQLIYDDSSNDQAWLDLGDALSAVDTSDNPDEDRTVVISEPGAALEVSVIHLSEATRKSLTTSVKEIPSPFTK